MTSAAAGIKTITVRFEERTFPPYDPFHGTNQPMLWRRVTIETASGEAALEQTDYGHAGRLNAWEPRGIAPSLVAKLTQLRAIAEAVAAV